MCNNVLLLRFAKFGECARSAWSSVVLKRHYTLYGTLGLVGFWALSSE
jgi:hypothetical protein